ncbi:GM19806 [Drosophila sechellia]|uniref:GM19806 n=1 Tax=Drosophila sechellia TaxID=7238 RepID=B4HPT6_DROSE|nr:GM19806 [Drosophila sechellia]
MAATTSDDDEDEDDDVDDDDDDVDGCCNNKDSALAHNQLQFGLQFRGEEVRAPAHDLDSSATTSDSRKTHRKCRRLELLLLLFFIWLLLLQELHKPRLQHAAVHGNCSLDLVVAVPTLHLISGSTGSNKNNGDGADADLRRSGMGPLIQMQILVVVLVRPVSPWSTNPVGEDSNAPVRIEPAAECFALIELLHLGGNPGNSRGRLDERCLPNVKSSNALNLKRKRGQDVDVGHECGMQVAATGEQPTPT